MTRLSRVLICANQRPAQMDSREDCSQNNPDESKRHASIRPQAHKLDAFGHPEQRTICRCHHVRPTALQFVYIQQPSLTKWTLLLTDLSLTIKRFIMSHRMIGEVQRLGNQPARNAQIEQCTIINQRCRKGSVVG
jgi:hypothetical protein